MEKILFQNKLCFANEVSIIPFDKGLTFGGGIYEVIAFYNKKLVFLEQHLKRLAKSANSLKIKLPYSLDDLKENLTTLVNQSVYNDGTVFLQVTGRSISSNVILEQNHSVLVMASVNEAVNKNTWENGIKLYVTKDIRWDRCDIKSLNLLGASLTLEEARENGCDDSLLHKNSQITECSSANIFVVSNNAIYTPPENNFILSGTRRRILIELAKKANIDVHETPFSPLFLNNVDEIFTTSTNTFNEIQPVVSLKGEVNRNLAIGNITKLLQQEYRNLLKSYIE